MFPLPCSFLSPSAFYKHLNILINTEEFGLSKKNHSGFIKILRIIGPSLTFNITQQANARASLGSFYQLEQRQDVLTGDFV